MSDAQRADSDSLASASAEQSLDLRPIAGVETQRLPGALLAVGVAHMARNRPVAPRVVTKGHGPLEEAALAAYVDCLRALILQLCEESNIAGAQHDRTHVGLSQVFRSKGACDQPAVGHGVKVDRTHQKFIFRINEVYVIGGESGIRTHGRFDPSPVFKTGALNRSAISPVCGPALGRGRILA